MLLGKPKQFIRRRKTTSPDVIIPKIVMPGIQQYINQEQPIVLRFILELACDGDGVVTVNKQYHK